jgi:maleate cis-trans isomerase
MFGWRGRIGLIVPSSNSTFEPEMKAMCPDGVEVYATRVAFTADEQGLKGMRQHVRRASRDFAAEGPSNIIVFGCTLASMIEGKGYDDKICAEITAETGIPAIATTTVVHGGELSLTPRAAAYTVPGIRYSQIVGPPWTRLQTRERSPLADLDKTRRSPGRAR